MKQMPGWMLALFLVFLLCASFYALYLTSLAQ